MPAEWFGAFAFAPAFGFAEEFALAAARALKKSLHSMYESNPPMSKRPLMRYAKIGVRECSHDTKLPGASTSLRAFACRTYY